MKILLPPSETKRTGGDSAFDPASLAFDAELREARDRVRAALEELSRGDADVAAKALKLGVKNRRELEYNLELGMSGAMAAIDRYTGVLYDALDVSSLDQAERAWVDEHVFVQSALFGLVSAGDRIPAYRLSASTRLPALGAPLKRVWTDAHSSVILRERSERRAERAERVEVSQDLILDLRSKDYAALAPLPQGVGWYLEVTQRGDDGELRALNHFNKAAKGDLVRRLARSRANIDTVEELLSWSNAEGLECTADASTRTVTLVTRLGV